ncbi:MAG TPA: hypothetical protein VG028_00110 [Terriglobia bacterium]|nr:hypothetical protein [Terriglobia bacterium]
MTDSRAFFSILVAREHPLAPLLKSSIRVRAFAKINLGLNVRARRRDGFHEIFTVYQTIALHDRLTIHLAQSEKGILVRCDDPGIPSGRENLVHRACALWARARHYGGGIKVELEKRIPAGSGLGGGSSDAAAALLGLERLTGDRLGLAARLKLAARLGSDVPLFLWGGRVLGCGRGEEVYPLWDFPRRPCLVVFPTFPVSTAEAYRELDQRSRVARQFAAAAVSDRRKRLNQKPTVRDRRYKGSSCTTTALNLGLTKESKRSNICSFGAWPHFPLEFWGPAENDFEQVVFARWPELAGLKSQLIRAGAETASLTGSGSAVFALFDSAPKMIRASKLIPAHGQVFKTNTLPRDEYERLIF